MHVLLVHGAGLDHASFGPVLDRLARAGVSASAPPRRGYDGRPPTADLEVHVDDLVAAIDALDSEGESDVVVAGVSGGATLALALAVRGHPRLVAAVAHEPLVGPLAPDQHQRITASIDQLRRDAPRASVTPALGPAVEAFVRRLVGEATWSALSPELQTRAVANPTAVRVEADGFAHFAVTHGDLVAAASVLTWTVGRSSDRWRHDAAEMAALAGVAVRLVDGRHTPQLDDPDGWFDAVACPGVRP